MKTLLEAATSEVEPTKTQLKATDSQMADILENKSSVVADSFADLLLPVNQSSPRDIYEAVLPFILKQLEQPKDDNH